MNPTRAHLLDKLEPHTTEQWEQIKLSNPCGGVSMF